MKVSSQLRNKIHLACVDIGRGLYDGSNEPVDLTIEIIKILKEHSE